MDIKQRLNRLAIKLAQKGFLKEAQQVLTVMENQNEDIAAINVNSKTKQLLDELQKALKEEYTAFLQYQQDSFLILGPIEEKIEDLFEDQGEQELEHIKELSEKMVAMGGQPVVEHDPIINTEDLKEMLEHNLHLERTAIEHYTSIANMCGDDLLSLRLLIEHILEEEREHFDELQEFYVNIDRYYK